MGIRKSPESPSHISKALCNLPRKEVSCARIFVVYFSVETLDTMREVFHGDLSGSREAAHIIQSLMHLDTQLTVLRLKYFL